MKLSKLLNIIVVVIVALTLSAGKRPVTIFIVGDSTAANKNNPDTNPERGWGMALQGFFDSNVIVDNHAVNGRSSKSFMDEGRWAKVVELIKPGDYVIIQFGHNDEKPKADRHTDPGTTFDAHLQRYVDETKEKGGIPILMNSVVRRNFFRKSVDGVDDESLRNTIYQDEKVNSDTLIDTHGDYLISPQNVAVRNNIVFIDANAITHGLEQSLGVVGSRRLHMWFKPGEIPSIPKGRQDNTHYNVYGAHCVASLLASELVAKVPKLRRYMHKYDYIVSKRGFGNYLDLQAAIDAAPAKGKTRIHVLDGKWDKSLIDLKGKKITFDLFDGAEIE